MKEIKRGVKVGKPFIVGALIGVIVILGLYLLIGLTGILKYSLIITYTSILVTIAVMVILAICSRKISDKVEPEDDKEILRLKMNQGLGFSTLLFGAGLAFVIPGITITPPTGIVGLILITGLFFIILGMLMFSLEYIPRLEKLIRMREIEILLKSKEKKKK